MKRPLFSPFGLAVLLLAAAAGGKLQTEPARALQIHEEAILVDGHNDLPLMMIDFGFDLRMDGDEESDRTPGSTSLFRRSLGGPKAIAFARAPTWPGFARAASMHLSFRFG